MQACYNLAAAPLGLVIAAPALGQGFPVTLAHAYGETDIPERPERIATIGGVSQDAVLALGQVPAVFRCSWAASAGPRTEQAAGRVTGTAAFNCGCRTCAAWG